MGTIALLAALVGFAFVVIKGMIMLIADTKSVPRVEGVVMGVCYAAAFVATFLGVMILLGGLVVGKLAPGLRLLLIAGVFFGGAHGVDMLEQRHKDAPWFTGLFVGLLVAEAALAVLVVMNFGAVVNLIAGGGS